MVKLSKATEEATAYHEAGHAVVALRVGLRIGRRGVSILPGEGSAGTAHVLPTIRGSPVSVDGAARFHRVAEKHAMVCLAGDLAQAHYRRSSWRTHHGSQDRQQAIALVSRIVSSKDELEAYLQLLLIRARNMVTSAAVWSQIVAVAEALLSRKTLTPAEVWSVASAALTRGG